jgi:hypothetical protein
MSRRLPWAAVVLALAPAAGGVALFVAGNQPAVSGWTTYGPDPGSSDAYRSQPQLAFDEPRGVCGTRTSALGAGAAVLGLLVLPGVAGWGAGRQVVPEPVRLTGRRLPSLRRVGRGVSGSGLRIDRVGRIRNQFVSNLADLR